MKSFKIFKQADIWLQVLAFLVPILCSLAGKRFYVFYAYFTVGAVQMLSCFINSMILPAAIRSRGRRYYEWILIFIIAIGILLAVMTDKGEGVLLLGAVLIPASIFLAIWYWDMAGKELRTIRNTIVNQKENE